MKKISFILLAAALLLTGCGNADIITDTGAEPASEAQNAPGFEAEEVLRPESEYDIDLTKLSSSMVYAQVYDMVYSSDDYIGQSVKVSGQFSYYKDPQTDNEYFAVLVSDAAACCSQGIEFVLDGEYSYPEDYPETGTDITVTGRFSYYKENYATYVQLTDAELTINA